MKTTILKHFCETKSNLKEFHCFDSQKSDIRPKPKSFGWWGGEQYLIWDSKKITIYFKTKYSTRKRNDMRTDRGAKSFTCATTWGDCIFSTSIIIFKVTLPILKGNYVINLCGKICQSLFSPANSIILKIFRGE